LAIAISHLYKLYKNQLDYFLYQKKNNVFDIRHLAFCKQSIIFDSFEGVISKPLNNSFKGMPKLGLDILSCSLIKPTIFIKIIYPKEQI